jgi:hypothetical protein
MLLVIWRSACRGKPQQAGGFLAPNLATTMARRLTQSPYGYDWNGRPSKYPADASTAASNSNLDGVM